MAREAAVLSQRLSANKRSGLSSRIRTPEDIAIITRMAILDVERRRAEGRLVRLGPREYELRPRTTAPLAARNATITS